MKLIKMFKESAIFNAQCALPGLETFHSKNIELFRIYNKIIDITTVSSQSLGV